MLKRKRIAWRAVSASLTAKYPVVVDAFSHFGGIAVGEVWFTVHGKVGTKHRHRMSFRDKHGRVLAKPKSYKDPRTAKYQQDVLLAYAHAEHRPTDMLDEPIEVSIYAYFKMPKAKSKKYKSDMAYKPCPMHKDADNIAKVVCDALNGYAYKDDRLVTDLIVKKRYSQDSQESVTVCLRWGDDLCIRPEENK